MCFCKETRSGWKIGGLEGVVAPKWPLSLIKQINKITLVYPDLFKKWRYLFTKGLWTIRWWSEIVLQWCIDLWQSWSGKWSKSFKTKALEKGARRNGRFPLTSKIYWKGSAPKWPLSIIKQINKITLVYPDLFKKWRYQFTKGLWTIKMMKWDCLAVMYRSVTQLKWKVIKKFQNQSSPQWPLSLIKQINKITLVYPDLFKKWRYLFTKGLWTIKMMKWDCLAVMYRCVTELKWKMIKKF